MLGPGMGFRKAISSGEFSRGYSGRYCSNLSKNMLRRGFLDSRTSLSRSRIVGRGFS